MFDTKNIFSILFDELWARPDFGPDMSGQKSGQYLKTATQEHPDHQNRLETKSLSFAMC